MPTSRKTSPVAGIAVLLLAVGIWLAAVWGTRQGYLGGLLPLFLSLLLSLGLAAWAAPPVFRRLSRTVWLGAGLLCLAGLAWPTSLLVEHVLKGRPPVVGLVVVG